MKSGKANSPTGVTGSQPPPHYLTQTRAMANHWRWQPRCVSKQDQTTKVGKWNALGGAVRVCVLLPESHGHDQQQQRQQPFVCEAGAWFGSTGCEAGARSFAGKHSDTATESLCATMCRFMKCWSSLVAHSLWVRESMSEQSYLSTIVVVVQYSTVQ